MHIGLRLLLAAGLCLAVLPEVFGGVAAAQEGDAPSPFVAIQGPDRVNERRWATFAAVLPDRPLENSADGYEPSIASDFGATIPVEHESAVELRWDFGDGSPVVTTGERVSIPHAFMDQGEYTVTVQVHGPRGLWAEANHAVTVQNLNPTHVRAEVVEVDPGNQTVELTASAQDVPDDPLTFTWEFGDGERRTGPEAELWKVRHQYLVPGRYTATLTVTDDDGGERNRELEVLVEGTGPRPSTRIETDAPPDADVLESGFDARLGGATGGELVAEVRPARGLYLSAIAPGVCRFVFTAWDDARLAYVHGVADLAGVPPEGGRFRVPRPLVSVTFAQDADAYLLYKANALRGMTSQQLRDQLLERLPADPEEGDLSGIGDPVGRDVSGGEGPRRSGRPLGSPVFDRRVAYKTVSGDLDLTFVPADRAKGRYELVLESSDEELPKNLRALKLEAEIRLDLVAARKDGMVRYEGCEPPPFTIEEVSPEDGDRHLRDERPAVKVEFDRPYDPGTLDDESFRLTYPDPQGRPVKVVGRVLRGADEASFVPDDPLLPGVEHTAWVRTGDSGVRSRGGEALADDGTGWARWSFHARLEFIPKGDGVATNLACHLFQAARDAPLIPGRPAVGRVYASWAPVPQAADEAQMKAFEARVSLRDAKNRELAATVHRFVRPDQWDAAGVDLRHAEHTAQVFGLVPEAGIPAPLRVVLEVATHPGDSPRGQYFSACPLEVWDHAPELSVDILVLPMGSWADPGALQAMMPTVREITAAAELYAWQIFPFFAVDFSSPRTVSFPEGMKLPPDDPIACPAGCLMSGAGSAADGGSEWWKGLDGWLAAQSTADVVVAFVPHGRIGAGSTGTHLERGRGTVLTLAGSEEQYFDRYVFALVHELGHVLGLDHLPYVANSAERKRWTDLRTGDDRLWFEGIEAMRLAADGRSASNKSSLEGNAESEWLVALMVPGTVADGRAFTANHHYRRIQRLLERLRAHD